ncbi:MAG TPA: cyclopropane-fatty-acyl-phospholipid synthase, partial [Gammaproteobacteria bacterium]|nr:cyclopropane-fatty-acyl-phospholipid synthase [Gammaproteobacteria bacterium]
MTTSNPVFGKDRPEKRGAASRPSKDRSRNYERYLLRRVLDAMGSPCFTVALWDGFSISPEGATSVATLRVHNRFALNQLLRQGDAGFGDAFSSGGISVEGDLVALLVAAFSAPEPQGIASVVKRVQQRKPRANTHDGSRENIHHHYDIGNDFYQLWLDKEMQYTCAYFP